MNIPIETEGQFDSIFRSVVKLWKARLRVSFDEKENIEERYNELLMSLVLYSEKYPSNIQNYCQSDDKFEREVAIH